MLKITAIISIISNILLTIILVLFFHSAIDLLENAAIEKKKSFTLLNAIIKQKPIVFVGDSIIEGYPTEEFYPDKYVINRGIGGDTSLGVLSRLDDNVLSLTPTKIFIMVGTNDLFKKIKPDIIIQTHKKIVHRIKETVPKTRIYLISVLPVNQTFKSFGSQILLARRDLDDIRLINQGLKKIASETDCSFIDTAKTVSDENGNLKKEYTREGLHLNGKGYIAFSKNLKPFVEGYP